MGLDRIFLLRDSRGQVLAFYVIAATIVSAIMLPTSLEAYAACATYSSTSNTITITCDTTWSEAISGLAASAVVDQGNGEYIVGNIIVRDGVRLTIDSGTWLKITGANGITVYGYLDADSVKITSWDTAANSIIDNQGSGPRAYIRYRAGDGGTIQNSELAYLGYLCSGSCTYKRGISLETYGGAGTQGVDMVGNTFHHNYYAYYTNAAYDLVVDGNEFYSNTQYDIDPHTATHDMQITNNHIHDSGRYGIICSLDCYNILIEGNRVHDMTNVGIFFSRNMHDSVARNNEIWNVPTGILFSESPDNEAYGNSIHDVRRGIYFLNPRRLSG
jgi:mannuronan 5-epimerase